MSESEKQKAERWGAAKWFAIGGAAVVFAMATGARIEWPLAESVANRIGNVKVSTDEPTPDPAQAVVQP